MFKFLVILSIVYSSLIHASFSLPMVNWSKLTNEQQASVWLEYRTTLNELETSVPDVVASQVYSLLQEAYAGGFDCLVAGWPSGKANGKCASPKQMNSRYAHHVGCSDKQLLCNPAVFGENLCIEFETSAQKNSAFAQCEKLFAKEGRLFSQVLSEVHPEEMQDLISTVHAKCSINSSNYSCQKLRKKLDFLIPNETPVSYKAGQQSLGLLSPDKILSSAKNLQREMESDIATFERICADGIQEVEKLHCKNLALRVKKSEALLPKLLSRVDSLIKPIDCVNCSSYKSTELLTAAAMPKVPAENLQCTEVEKKKISAKCFEDVKCVILATAMSAPTAVMEAFGKKPAACISSQNSCLTNVVSALIDSLWSLVTGIWDLLGSALEWSGEKLANFWDYVTKVEDKTSDAQQMLNKMSAKDVEEVKKNPIQWISNLAGNIWKGLGEWMKEDIYCEQWAGVPRASACVQPSRGFDCMSCRTMITGTCSAAGVIIAEVVPALLTGGGANLVAKVGSGAKTFSKFIKVSKSYKKIVTAVDKLSDVRAIKILTKGTKATAKVVKVATRPISQATKYSIEVASSSYKAMVKTKGYQKLSKAMDVAAKYSGIKAYNKLQNKMFDNGYEFVDAAMGVKPKKIAAQQVMAHADDATKLVQEVGEDFQPMYDDLIKAEAKAAELRKLKDEGAVLSRIDKLNEAQLKRISELAQEIRDAEANLRIASNEFTDKLMIIYQKKNIPATIMQDTNGAKTLSLDFNAPPTGNRAFELYRQVHKKFGLDNVTVSVNDNFTIGSLGFFSSSAKRIDMGPGQAFDLMRDYFNSVSKHESRHAMFFAKRARGEDSVFHAQFMASPDGHLLNADKYFYDTYMSAEELYTFSTDLQSLAQVFKGEMVTNLAQREALLAQIAKKGEHLTKVAKTSQTMSEAMLKSLDNILAHPNRPSKMGLLKNKDGTWNVSFKDKLGRSTRINLVGPEEKQIAQNIMDLNVSLTNQIDVGIQKILLDDGVDLTSLGERIKAKKITDADKAALSKSEATYIASVEGQQVLKQLDDASIPLIHNSRAMLEDLRKLSVAQIKEAEDLDVVIKAYADKQKGGSALQLKALRDQMIKTAKNVKEDYKGYALNTP